MMIDFRKLDVGTEVPFKGLTLRVSEISKRRGGWVRVLATLDGLRAIIHRRCICDRNDGEILVVDLVTEEEHLCCAACRRSVELD